MLSVTISLNEDWRQLNKICVFCGNKPNDKSVEHVIPEWLIELTGNPKRMANFGYDHSADSDPKIRSYSFDAFKFPACVSCNQKYSILEADAKIIIEKLLACKPLAAGDFHVLLSWFDKVRVGLWLGFQYLDKNLFGITPKFYIQTRIGLADRMLAIFKTKNEARGINFIGCDFPSFYFTPSCFTLRIKDFFFLNISYMGLFSRRIGFPYIDSSFAWLDQTEACRHAQGRERIMTPLLKKRLSIHGKEIYQPMFGYYIKSNEPDMGIYDTQYVRDNSMIWSEGIGDVFIQNDQKFYKYPKNPSCDYVPNTLYDIWDLFARIKLETLEWQKYIDNLGPSLKLLPLEKKKEWLRERRMKNYANKLYRDMLIKQSENRQ